MRNLKQWTFRARVIGIAAVAVATPLAVVGVAWAAVTDNLVPTANYAPTCFGHSDPSPPTQVCQTDNSTVTFYMDSNDPMKLETEDKATVRNVLSTDFAPTDLAISEHSSPTLSGAAETDIIYQESSEGIDDDLDGYTWCNDPVDSEFYKCDQQYVRIRGYGAYTYGLTCHETGHAVGLVHGTYASPALANSDDRLGCMQLPVGWSTGLGSNNKDNINSVYPVP